MNRIVVTALLISCCCTSFADSRESVDKTLEVSSGGFVTIEVARGDLEVSGWEKSEVNVSGMLDKNTEKFIFEVNGDDRTCSLMSPSYYQ